MRKFTKILLPVFCLSMLVSTQAFAAETVSFNGSGSQQDDELAVSVIAEQGGACSGQVTLSYDPETVELIDADYGSSIIEDSVRSLNKDANDGTAVEMGFADLQAIEAGDVLNASFKIAGEEPDEGIVFHVDIAEWSDEDKNDLTDQKPVSYDIVFKDGQVVVNPQEPENPDTPDQPTTPDQPNTPNQPGSSADGKNPGAGKTDLPGSPVKSVKSGDNSPIVPLCVAAAAGAAVACTVVYKRKRA